MLSFLLLSVLATAAVASPVNPRAAAPSVTIKNGTVVGSTSDGVDSFKGIPFAQPPVGPLRLKRPASITKTFGTIQATGTPTSCPQQEFDTNAMDLSGIPTAALAQLLNTPLFQKVTNTGEDCLTLNVQKPSTATSSSKLPVIFWIYGGGFELGSTGMYDGASLVSKSTSLESDVIYVSTNYRVSAWGFMGSKELQNEGNTNLGLRDQRKALEWVAENIEAFGGDPSKVTIWGESAGAISVFDQTIINRGDNTYNGKELFRGAIMNSGSVVPAQPVDHPKAQAVYDTVVESAGCSGQSDTLACLRSLDAETFANAASSVPGILSYQSINLAYLPRPDPNDNFFPVSPDEVALDTDAPAVAPVPIIIGDQEDEGTLFSLFISNVTTTDKFTDYLQDYFTEADRSVISGLLDLYPTDPSAGSPFGTGILNQLYPEYKRNAAVLGDATFTLARRGYLSAVTNENIKAWSYLNSYIMGTPILGTLHGSDLLSIYYGVNSEVQSQYQTYYIAFTNNLDPNGLGGVTWPQWTNDSRQLLHIKAATTDLTTDNFRDDAANYLVANAAKLRV